MDRKALKNVPKPDEEKLALFYGREAEMSTVDTVSTVDIMSTVDNKGLSTMPEEPQKKGGNEISTMEQMTTVDKMSTVVNGGLRITASQQSIYQNLYNRSFVLGKDTTSWVGYTELAKETELSLKTVQRAINKLINLQLIRRSDFTNTAKCKGSQYQVTLAKVNS